MSEQNLVQGFVNKFRDQHTITVATGVTCAYLGDERNLREYLLADEVVKALRSEGHVVHFLCFNDDLDGLTFRQLRVAVNKDPHLVAKFEPYCGKPICDIRAPYDQDLSWSEHFANVFSERLQKLDCNPNVVSVAKLYDRGLYAPYIRQVLVQQDRIRDYLGKEFPDYHPEKLYWPVCPVCGYIDSTTVGHVSETHADVMCTRCLRSTSVSFEELRGKLNWKLDCAVRWSLFGVAAEPFSKAYLEPHAGSFFVAQGLSKTFFGGKDVSFIPYGTVSMPTSLGGKIMDCLPADVVRSLFVRSPRADLEVSEERIITEANKVEVLPDLKYADVVKQLLPIWMLDPADLSGSQRELMIKGISYAREFDHREIRPFLPNRSHIETIPLEILRLINAVIQEIIILRRAIGDDYERFKDPAKASIQRLGDQRKQVTMHFRKIINQDQGVPNSRFLFLLPMSYLMNLKSLIELYLQANEPRMTHAVVQTQIPLQPPLRVVSGERLAFEH